jgi:hypothetical protein
VIVYANCVVDDASPATARQTMRAIMATLNGNGLQPTMAPVAFAGEMAALIEEGGADALRDRMPDAWLHELAITGGQEDARAAVNRYADAGAEAVILVPPDDSDWDSWLAAQAWATPD